MSSLPTPGPGVSRRQEALLSWWARSGRHDLPWRHTRDPWAVVVSELMLQQTQVARVVPRFHAFMARFPDAATCAAATPGDVVRMWSGLGYNRRALHLHQLAVACVERHGGSLPADLGSLLALPGVGPYTARAVLVFAFEHDLGVVDSNVGRVLARWEGRSLTSPEAQALADAAVPSDEGWAWSQALFDLGSAVCLRRAPRCGACSVVDDCAFGRSGGEGDDPATATAGVSKGQSRFDGSDRQGRGRLVASLRDGPQPLSSVATIAGWPDDPARTRRVLDGLLADGLVVVDGDRLRLP